MDGNCRGVVRTALLSSEKSVIKRCRPLSLSTKNVGFKQRGLLSVTLSTTPASTYCLKAATQASSLCTGMVMIFTHFDGSGTSFLSSIVVGFALILVVTAPSTKFSGNFFSSSSLRSSKSACVGSNLCWLMERKTACASSFS